MELASGLGFEGHHFTACAVNQLGDELSIPLKELYKRGLPTCAKPVRRRIDTDLANWRVIDGQPYLDAFGFKGLRPADGKHEFFEVKDGNWTYVIPALALMKAIFRPTKHLLAEMFLPHALDQQCRLEVSERGVSVVPEPEWTNSCRRLKCGDVQPLFTWLMLYASAFNMAGSVHENALHGRIGLTLPNAKLRVVLKGLNSGQTLFVTEAAVTSVSPLEEPVFEKTDHPSTLFLFNRDSSPGKSGSVGTISKQFVIPFRQTGETALTDQEWGEIEPIILAARKFPRPFVLSQRLILDGVLEKLATGKPWKQVVYPVGNWGNAFQAFRKWSGAGIFDEILRVLGESRNAP